MTTTTARWAIPLLLLAASCTTAPEAGVAELEGEATPSDEPPTPGCVPWILCNTAPPWAAVVCDPMATGGDECDGLEAAAACRADGVCAAAAPPPAELCPRDEDGNGLCRGTDGVLNVLFYWHGDQLAL